MRSHSKGLLAVAALFVSALLLPSLASAAQVRPHSSFGSEISSPGSIAVDPSNGDVYVVEPGAAGSIRRFDSSGAPKTFSALAGSNVLNGSDVGSDNDQTPANGLALDAGSQVAIDRSGGATDGNIYVADSGSDFSGAHGTVAIFASSGAYLGQLDGSGTPQGAWAPSFAYPCGVAVDQSSGDLYVSTASGGQINRYVPSGAVPADGDYEAQIGEVFTCALAADSSGAIYTAPTAFGSSGAAIKYAASDFGTNAPAGTQVAPSATALAVDPTNDDVYLDTSTQIEHLDSAGAPQEAPFGSGSLTNSHGVGVHATADSVYASDSADGQVHLFGAAVSITAESATEVVDDSATLNGTINPGGVGTSYYFEYSIDGIEWARAPGFFNFNLQGPPCTTYCAQPVDIGAGSADVAVSQSTESVLDSGNPGAQPIPLRPNTEYRVRLVAVQGDALAISPEVTFTTVSRPPDAQTRSAGVTTTTANLAGRVRPQGASTLYWFEYGAADCASNPCTSVPAGEDGDAGSGHDWIEVSQGIENLTPGGVYHYRVVAQNEHGEETAGQDRTFITLSGAPEEPPIRGFAKLSPDDKNGFESDEDGIVVDDVGARAGFSIMGMPVGGKNGQSGTLLSTRRPDGGWDARPVEPPLPPGASGGVLAFTPGATSTILQSNAAFLPEADEGQSNLYLGDDNGNALELLTPIQNGGSHQYVGTALDDARIFYGSSAPQITAPVSEGTHVYMWTPGGVELIDWVDPDADGPEPEQSSPQGAAVGSGPRGEQDSAISRDGERVVFHATPSGGSDFAPAGQLFVRDMRAEPPRTVHVSATERAVPDPLGPLPALFWDAEREHAEKVLFTSCEKLTDDSTADASKDAECANAGLSTSSSSFGAYETVTGRDLYLFDLSSEDLIDLTTTDPAGAEVLGVIGTSESLDTIYFAAAGVLAAGAIRGERNVYVWSDGQISYIATLERGSAGYDVTSTKSRNLKFGTTNWTVEKTGFAFYARSGASRVEADGSSMVFVARAPLTGYDNRNPSACPPVFNGGTVPSGNAEGRCLQIYRYDFAADQIACLSCDPSGAKPLGDSFLTSSSYVENMSADGSRVFFESPNALAPQAGDSNGRKDVYVWDSGAVRLVSDGLSSAESSFVGATPSGDDAFIRTRARLVRSDRDGLYDIYDASVRGGFDPSPPPAGCEGDTCQSPPNPPNDPTPSSSSFRGAGDPAQTRRRCRNGRVKRKARCVKKGKKRPSRKARANNNRRTHR